MTEIFIDGSAGTTGLLIADRLSKDNELKLLILEGNDRKDLSARKKAVNSCDAAILCLPDDAAKETVSLIENDRVKVIDTSTAHRTAPGWDYGFSELTGQKDKIKNSKRVANPGCHASGFIALVRPLVENGLIKTDSFLACTSLTGYSGGGRKMIKDYENAEKKHLSTPRLYGLDQRHKHLKEMAMISGLVKYPGFLPVVAPFYSGMTVSVPLCSDDIGAGKKEVTDVLRDYYKGSKIVLFKGDESGDGFLPSGGLSGKDFMEIYVFGNDERILLVSRFDNLGKGASGAAIQNLNIMLGRDETCGLLI